MCSLGFQIEGNPPCHVCGVPMQKIGDLWRCQACGATTGVEAGEAQPKAEEEGDD